MAKQNYQRRTDLGTVIYGPNDVNVGEFASTLEQLLNNCGLALAEDVKVITLIPDSDNTQTIYWENSNGNVDPYDPYIYGLADEYSPKLPHLGICFECNFESLKTITFYAANSVSMTVIQQS